MDEGAWQNSGAAVYGLPVGNHTVDFNTVTGFTAPDSQTVVIKTGKSVAKKDKYTANRGALKVNLNPSAASVAGARWQVDGGEWQSSGATVTALSAGSHTVNFNSVSGYTSPVSHTVTIKTGKTTIANDTFILQGSIANGTYSHYFGSEVPLWDISGAYSGSPLLSTIDFTISEDSTGKLTGLMNFDYNNGAGNVLKASGPLKGSMQGAGGVSRCVLNPLLSGSATQIKAGKPDNTTFTAKEAYNCKIDGSAHTLVITRVSAVVKAADLTTGKNSTETGSLGVVKGNQFSLPEDVNGNWNLTLNLTPSGTGYAGTATVRTSTGGTADLTATGNYSSATNTSSVVLTGTGGSLKLIISTSGSDMSVLSLKGTLYGQSLNYKAP